VIAVPLAMIMIAEQAWKLLSPGVSFLTIEFFEDCASLNCLSVAC
jgi:hypothetical protein